jgi:hypothetical protein
MLMSERLELEDESPLVQVRPRNTHNLRKVEVGRPRNTLEDGPSFVNQWPLHRPRNK